MPARASYLGVVLLCGWWAQPLLLKHSQPSIFTIPHLGHVLAIAASGSSSSAVWRLTAPRPLPSKTGGLENSQFFNLTMFGCGLVSHGQVPVLSEGTSPTAKSTCNRCSEKPGCLNIYTFSSLQCLGLARASYLWALRVWWPLPLLLKLGCLNIHNSSHFAMCLGPRGRALLRLVGSPAACEERAT